MLSLFILFFSGFVNVLSEPAITLNHCKPGNNECVTKVVRTAYLSILGPNVAIGAEELDPMFQKFIKGDLSSLKFKMYNTVCYGYRFCKIKEAKYDNMTDKLQVHLKCPFFTLEGQYEVHGRLLIIPIEGYGNFTVKTSNYDLLINLTLHKVEKYGRKYKHIKSFIIRAEPLEPVHYDFHNLFNGQNGLGLFSAEAVLNFANDSWKEVAEELQDPVFKATFKKIINNANKFLKTIPIDEYGGLEFY